MRLNWYAFFCGLYQLTILRAEHTIYMHYFNRKLPVLIVLFSLLFVFSAIAAESRSSYIPAHFPKTTESLISRIKFPPIPGDVDVTIFCSAMVSKRSKIENNRCFSVEENRDTKYFLKSVDRASRVARIVNAEVDGKPVRAQFSYRIRFIRKEEKTKIFGFPNHGLDEERYGYNYSQAQQITNGHRGRIGCNSLKSILIGLVINESGQPSDVKIIRSKGASNKCKSSFINDLSQDSYIPAMLEGRSLSSSHMISVFFDSKSRADSKSWERIVEPDKS